MFNLNFAQLYGATPEEVREIVGPEEAARIVADFFERYPKIKETLDA